MTGRRAWEEIVRLLRNAIHARSWPRLASLATAVDFFTGSEAADGGEGLDLIVADVPYLEQVARRAEPIEVEGIRLPVATLEDLPLPKPEAGRAQDLDDAVALRARGDTARTGDIWSDGGRSWGWTRSGFSTRAVRAGVDVVGAAS